MFNFADIYQLIAQDPKLQSWLNILPKQLSDWQKIDHGDFNHWLKVLDKIDTQTPDHLDLLNSVTAYNDKPLDRSQNAKLTKLLQSLHPWRKGPYHINGIYINTEWRSDWKWDRIIDHISPLTNRRVLDVGCGNGYHMWRMLGQGASLCIGIDPSHLFLIQFATIRKLLGNPSNIHLLPLGIKQLPELDAFDTVFSMGVLYHRRSPLDHLIQLKNQLRSQGELVLETLVIDGDQTRVLVPNGRYAQMRNVYFLPSALALKVWLEQVGFINAKIVDETVTTIDEQRTTNWMRHNSLKDYIDEQDHSKTIEGYPAPCRATLIATKP